jgi:arylsulfatase A-like enzyme
VPPALPDEPRVRRELAGYRTLARQMDRMMGTVLGALERSGLADETLVVCTTDHGVDFPRMKCTLRDDGLEAFLMLRGPRTGPGSELRGGTVLEPMVTHLDVFPTLCDVCGIERPARLEGSSLLPFVRGEVDRLHDAIFGEVNYHAAYQPMRSVRTDRYKYIRRFYERSTPVKPNEAPNPTRDVLEEHGWAHRAEPREELYDLIHDPNEANNRIEDPDYAAVARELRERLEQWMRDKDDPLRHGHIELPEGGKTVIMEDPSNHGEMWEAERWNAALRAEGA